MVNLACVADGLGQLPANERPGNSRQSESGDRRDNGDNDEHFDKGKSSEGFLRHGITWELRKIAANPLTVKVNPANPLGKRREVGRDLTPTPLDARV
jgi:hypothetical protein